MQQSLRLAVDIGGTFTDTVLIEDADRIVASTKTLTTHQNPADGAIEGVRRALSASDRGLGEVTGFIHGTTLATNALIEKRGARVVTVTTEGFRDILEIGYERRYSQYDINLRKADLLVGRDRSLTIRERMSADGQVLIPLDEGAIPDLVAQIDAAGAEAIAICLLHSYANPLHEQRLREAIASARPGLSISISSEVSPEAREFDRLCTTLANAYIQPLMARYLSAFEARFAVEGLACPILMMTAGGGMTTVRTAAAFPIRLVESGPAGGAILAARIASECGLENVLSFDMGGTTAKLCLIDGGSPQTSRAFEIARAARFIKGSGMPVRIPVIEMIEIGAGGGSIAAIDRLGRLTVGPQSAGSEPGPVAFGRGGTQPTVSDADIVLGYIRPETFAEGQFTIDPAPAAATLAETLGERLSTGAPGAADGVSRIVDENMASAARMHAVESGKDLGARTMIAFGGNGPLHACRVARAAGISRILIPANPGVGSAVGFLFAPVSYEIVRSRYSLLETLDLGGINALLSGMVAEATGVVRQGAPAADTAVGRTAFMRYHGQGHEIEIPLPDRDLQPDDIGPLTTAFETAYSRQFSRPVPGMSIEILNWSVRVATRAEAPAASSAEPPESTLAPDSKRTIICDLSGKPRDAAFVPRENLAPGSRITGPALIAEPQTTTFVGADFTARVDARGNLVLTRDRIGG
ncbi:hydantoinase/oxoprolinase family protein [Defluviimonas sp. WL0002]|uniref:Hydantoinase/oxoprolinase family protein n=1 Tax=Albidovulum marisflavi TaxID=2984159 RepID=A0ABT2ZBA6_9RHOB|nr:hydantoinase/oxoprolinase family protein [Defluviimonas sp. WL0002]MCV2868418.1 hydantoinase/oxoprolinase family protein [Defluviimonas sp. WL0002]